MRQRNFILTLAFLAVSTSLLSHASYASDWPRFRGPNGSGVAADNKPAPTEWSPTKHLKWKVRLPGSGVSSPIVVGDRVFATCYSGYGLDRRNLGNIKDLKRHLVCVDRKTGKTLWDKSVPATLPEDPYSGAGVPSHGYASHTPVSDGKRVYVFFGKTGALAFDMDGKKLWQKNLGKESDPRRWGSASSPILHNDVLIVTAGAESRSIYGLDVSTGKQLWKAEGSALGNVWGTPVLARVDDKRTDLVVGASGETWGLDPATGKLRWYNESISASNSSVVTNKGIIYAIESSRGGFGGFSGGSGAGGAIRAGGKKDTTKSHLVWTSRSSNRFGTPIVYKDRVYLVASGTVTCINAKTGKEVYRERLLESNDRPEGGGQRGGGRFGGFGRGGRDYSSPVIAAGNLYYVKRSGDVYVVKTGDKFKQLAFNRVTSDAENFSATPAISNGEIFLRSNRHLYCVSKTAKARQQDVRSNDSGSETSNVALEGPTAALAFERDFRSKQRRQSKPVDPECCLSITPLTKEMWTKKQVTADFQENRTPDQVGIIVFVKTEFCSKGARLCAVTTAAMEKKSTPLVGRFRIYMAWVKGNPDQKGADWRAWEKKVIREYRFQQGPGARIVAMVPKKDGEFAEWSSNASKLRLAARNFDRSKGETPQLERFLQRALDSLSKNGESPKPVGRE